MAGKHKDMAAAGGGNFGVNQTLGGVPSIKNQDSPANGKGISHAPMADSARHPPLSRGGMLNNQRHPDHGPQNIGSAHPDICRR